jgi:hypothetical protein
VLLDWLDEQPTRLIVRANAAHLQTVCFMIGTRKGMRGED